MLIDDDRQTKLSGLSHACHEECNINRELFCTDEFMSPEIALSLNFDKSVDIYSFGIILCEIITSKEPSSFCSTTLKEQFFLRKKKQIIFEVNEIKLQHLIPSDCPEEFEVLAFACCETDSFRRPTVHTCIEELEVILQLFEYSKGTQKFLFCIYL